MYILILQRLFLEALFDLVNFPVWWYTVGAKRALLWSVRLFQSGNRTLAPGLWLANLFVPMFGQFDWQGRIISFFMRFVQLIARTIALAAWGAVSIAFFALWILWPVIIVYNLIYAI